MLPRPPQWHEALGVDPVREQRSSTGKVAERHEKKTENDAEKPQRVNKAGKTRFSLENKGFEDGRTAIVREA